ncbi:MAG: serine peptidase, partial [Pseudolabrys sp.]
MTAPESNASRPGKTKILTGRRLALLGSVAVLGIAVLAGGVNGNFNILAFAPTSAAQAADAQSPSGFADLVARVK